MGALLIGLVAILGVGGGATYVAQDATPGDVLYPVKIASEEARTFVETNDQQRAELELEFVERRQAEIEKLAASGKLKAEHAREAQAHLAESIAEVEKIAQKIKHHDAIAAAHLALKADGAEDEFILALKDVPEQYHPEVMDLVAIAVDAATQNNGDQLALLAEAAHTNPDDETLHYELEREVTEEIVEAREHVAMLTQAITFGKTLENADFSAMLDGIANSVAHLQSAIVAAEKELAKTAPSLEKIFALVEQHNIPDARDLFEKIESYVTSHEDQFADVEYDGPWISEYDEAEFHGEYFEDPHAIEGECHTTFENENIVECYEDGEWVEYYKDVFIHDVLPHGEHLLDEPRHTDHYSFELPNYPEDWDIKEDGIFYHDEYQVDHEFEALKALYDADGDGEVDCIGEADCPGPDDPIWDAFDRPCDAECERWHEELEKQIHDKLHEHDLDEYDFHDHDLSPLEEEVSHIFGETYVEHVSDNDQRPEHYDDTYDPALDPYSGDEYDYPHEKDEYYEEKYSDYHDYDDCLDCHEEHDGHSDDEYSEVVKPY